MLPTDQRLHIVIGGQLMAIGSHALEDLAQVEPVGLYPNYAEAHAARRAKAQSTVDNALKRYFIVHAQGLLDPSRDDTGSAVAGRDG